MFSYIDVSLSPVLPKFHDVGCTILHLDLRDATPSSSQRGVINRWGSRYPESGDCSTVSTFTTHTSNRSFPNDCPFVSAGMFGLFTTALTVSHTHMICMNQSTVETFGSRAMKEREEMTLSKLHPFCAIGSVLSPLSCHQLAFYPDGLAFFSAKHRTKKQWDAEWGRIGKEGNIWWLGSKRRNWEAVMGKSVWWWFCEYRGFLCPIGLLILTPYISANRTQ